jgi:hypothetical protein
MLLQHAACGVGSCRISWSNYFKRTTPAKYNRNKIKIRESKDIIGEEKGVVPLKCLIAKVEKDMIVKALKSTNG